jgi:mono/diheme cytochrome c family protein
MHGRLLRWSAPAVLVGLTVTADAAPVRVEVGRDPGIALARAPSGERQQRPREAASVGNHGSTVIADTHGLLVVERSAGAVVRVDRSGKKRASVQLSPGLGEIVHDGAGGVFVADRAADRIVRIEPGDASGVGLASGDVASVPEPHGLALSPDGRTLYATSVSAHGLVALDTDTLTVKWKLELAPEPRGVAVSRDGRQIAVGFLSSGSIALVDSIGGRRVIWRSIEPRDHLETGSDSSGWQDPADVRVDEARSRFSVPIETGRRYARNLFTLAYIGHDTLVAAHQLATPQLERVPASDREDTYGGGGESVRPMLHRLAHVHRPGAIDDEVGYVQVDVHQPRALAYELERDVLYVGGYGDDAVVALADASGEAPYVDWVARVGNANVGDACGIDGLVVDSGEDGRSLWIHCEFGRRLLRLDLDVSVSGSQTPEQRGREWLQSEELATSPRSAIVERGAELYRRSDFSISDHGILACSNCHPEGRSDGLTWRLGKSIMQVPILAGRVGDTGPYKWDGQDETMHTSLRHTIERLGGIPDLPDADVDAMVAYLDSLPAPKPKPPPDAKAVSRGREVFMQSTCSGCHVGDKLTDRSQHDLDTTMDRVDTPSLIGLGHSRPYYHDGSATDVHTLLTDRGTIHEMADTSQLSDSQLRDLAAYLESL